jgi:hypothetical protein
MVGLARKNLICDEELHTDFLNKGELLDFLRAKGEKQ